MSETQERCKPTSVAIIGGGLAGIAAAESAANRGWNVELFEWSKVLGGRVASQFDARSHRWIDNGQHVILGCCTELLALNQRLGLADLFTRSESVQFAATDKKRWNLAASPFLPPRWQLVPAFLKNPFLSFSDRLFTGLLLRKMAKIPTFRSTESGNKTGSASALPLRTDLPNTFGAWLRKEGSSEDTVQNFWNPLIFSTLNETVDNVCLYSAVKVV
ncbi:MAG: FAD-dependent oxidoreductase, partial [Thermoguttaceae bacterium]